MESIIESIIISVIVDQCKEVFSGLLGRLRLRRVKRRLKIEVEEKILKEYGGRVFYSDFDRFLINNKVIDSIIKNCSNSSPFDYKPKTSFINYYLCLFFDEYPKYKRYYSEVYALLNKHFRAIFNSINPIKTESTRALCSVINQNFGEIKSDLENLRNTIDEINHKIDDIASANDKNITVFFREQYHDYIQKREQTLGDYLPRKLYEKKNDTEKKALDVLLLEKRVLVLGEAGYGKTTECKRLLRQICVDNRTEEYIPVFLPLLEYGRLYSNIKSGVCSKISPFCDGNSEELIDNWLRSGQLILILDGIDDICDDGYRSKFISEITDLTDKYSRNMVFITMRQNRYHNELSSFMSFTLSRIEEMTIRDVFRQEGITKEFPNDYYDLFSNPLYLEIGKRILKKQNSHRLLFNRSKLFEELFFQLYGEWDQQKGLYKNNPITYSEALLILGQFAFKNFDTPAFSYIKFERIMADTIPDNKREIINSFISSGLFSLGEEITFSHKLYKEFFAANYLVATYPLKEHETLFSELTQNDKWREVLIFASGLFEQVLDQDAFLDYIMKKNLPLYVECVNAKSDLFVDSINEANALGLRLLSIIHKTYTSIIRQYFNPIIDSFAPYNSTKYPGYKVGIIGCVTEEKHLDYWFDLIPCDWSNVVSIKSNELKSYREESEKRAIIQRRNISFSYINLELSGYPKDSGRSIALKAIKEALNRIIKDRKLFESKYLLCERVNSEKQKIKELHNCDNLEGIIGFIDKTVLEIENRTETKADEYIYYGVHLNNLRMIALYLKRNQVSFQDCLLPEGDLSYKESGANWIWSVYSNDQMIKRVATLLYYHDLSYHEMVLFNFPNLGCFLPRFLDYPYQTIATIDFKKEVDIHEHHSCPSICYYYIASEEYPVSYPKVSESQEAPGLEALNDKLNAIQNSYNQHCRKANRLVVSSTVFSTFLTTNRTGKNDPLAEWVYNSIKDDLEEVFGRFR